MNCSLCGSETTKFSVTHKRVYHNCCICKGILLDSSCFLSSKQEKKRYEIHNNDINDKGYQSFVSPIVQSILKEYTVDDNGLDFGSGTGPVITSLLKKQGYRISTYDPYFDLNPEALQKKYDYIACCEVMEHFHNPHQEFKLLHSLLNKKGSLYCKTSLYNKNIDFNSWWYKNDPTHVFFYTKETLEWIKNHFYFRDVFLSEKLIVFRK